MKRSLSTSQIAAMMEAQQEERRARLEEDIRAAEIPIPDQLIERMVWQDVGHSNKFFRLHPGYKTAKKDEAYYECTRMFFSAASDLETALAHYATFMKREDAEYRANDPEKSCLELAVLKFFFLLSNAAHALQDQSTRRMQDITDAAEVSQQIRAHFGSDHLHDFIIGIRTLIHHIHLHRPEAETHIEFSPRVITVRFYLHKGEFAWFVNEYGDKIGAGARQFISAMPEKVYIDELYRRYVGHAGRFHDWFAKHVEERKPPAVIDYQRCQVVYKQIGTRVTWRALIGNFLQWEKPPNPYNHLRVYLTEQQLEEITSLPHGSRHQIDRIIAIVDSVGACDENLREMIYQWFDKVQQTPA